MIDVYFIFFGCFFHINITIYPLTIKTMSEALKTYGDPKTIALTWLGNIAVWLKFLYFLENFYTVLQLILKNVC